MHSSSSAYRQWRNLICKTVQAIPSQGLGARKEGLVVEVVTQNSGDLAPIPGSDTNLV